MPIYVLGLAPLLDFIDVPDTTHSAYVDDIGAIRRLKALLIRWKQPETKIKITSEGRKHLGAAIGSSSHKKSYMKSKVNEWVSQLKLLSEIAKSYPHAAYCAFTAGFRHNLNYVMRTTKR